MTLWLGRHVFRGPPNRISLARSWPSACDELWRVYKHLNREESERAARLFPDPREFHRMHFAILDFLKAWNIKNETFTNTTHSLHPVLLFAGVFLSRPVANRLSGVQLWRAFSAQRCSALSAAPTLRPPSVPPLTRALWWQHSCSFQSPFSHLNHLVVIIYLHRWSSEGIALLVELLAALQQPWVEERQFEGAAKKRGRHKKNETLS